MHTIEAIKSFTPNMSTQWVSESAILIRISSHSGSESLLDKNRWLQAWANAIFNSEPAWLIDCVSAYSSLLIEFDPTLIDHYSVSHFLRTLQVSPAQSNDGKTHSIPVCYEKLGDDYPNDLSLVMAHTAKSAEEIIALHSEQAFRVYAVGFMPNFAYLGELHKSIHMPRLHEPRVKLPAGAVAIADNQTAIYPAQSPGGWHILAYTPLQLLHSSSHQFSVGDNIVFKAINKSDFFAMKHRA